MFSASHVLVLRLLNQSGALSRTGLVALTGLSQASISVVTAELLSRGLLTESDIVHGAGRPYVRLALAASSAFFIGASLAEDLFVVLVSDLHGKVVGRQEVEADLSTPSIARILADATDRLIREHDLDKGRVRGVGLAIPGLVDAPAGRCIRSTLLGWRDVDIGPMVARTTGLPIYVENDANALALGEHLFGALRGCVSGSLISIGEGIGCGHVLGGELYRGHRGGAGEIAHSAMGLEGLPCACGKRGCLDTMASLRAIASHALKHKLPADLAALEAAASRGRAEAVQILHRAGAALGLAISQLIQTLDPERIVVAFPIRAEHGLYMRVMRQTIEANLLPQTSDRTEVRVTAMGRDAFALGAASVAADRSLFRCL